MNFKTNQIMLEVNADLGFTNRELELSMSQLSGPHKTSHDIDRELFLFGPGGIHPSIHCRRGKRVYLSSSNSNVKWVGPR